MLLLGLFRAKSVEVAFVMFLSAKRNLRKEIFEDHKTTPGAKIRRGERKKTKINIKYEVLIFQA